MIVQPPKTLEEFKRVRGAILELMSNPHCDQFMFLSLSKKLNGVNAEIEKLKPLNTKQ